MIGVSTGISIGSFGAWSLATGIPVPSSLGQEAGTMIDAAALDVTDSYGTLTDLGNPYRDAFDHPNLYGQSLGLSTSPSGGDAGYMKTFTTPLSVSDGDTITIWFWQEYPRGGISGEDGYIGFGDNRKVVITVYSEASGGNSTQYTAALSWSFTRGWTPITIDLGAAATGVQKGVMNVPISGSGSDDFLTDGIARIYIQARDFHTEIGGSYSDDKSRSLEYPFIYGGMVLNQKHTPFFMPYFDDGYDDIQNENLGVATPAPPSPAQLTDAKMLANEQVGTLGIIADRILNKDGPYMTPQEIHDLYLGGWDIGLHGEHYWGYRSNGIRDLKQSKYTLTSSGTTATLQTSASWMRNPIADGSQIIVNSANVSEYVGTFTATRVDNRTVTFTIPDASDAAATTFDIDASWGPVAWDTQTNREAAKAAMKADMEYNLAFLQDPYTKLTEAGGFGDIEYLNGVDWTRGDPSSVLPGNAWRSSTNDWAYQLQASLDELGVNSARTSNPLMENSKTFPAGTNNDHYPTDFFVAGAVIENDFWLPETASSYNSNNASTAETIVNHTIPAVARQGGVFSPMIHVITDSPTDAVTQGTYYNRNDWHAVCDAAKANGLVSITASQYAKLQRAAGDATSSVTGLEYLDSSTLTATETTAIADFRRRLMRMGFWGSLKGLWIPALSGDNAKTNLITGVDLVDKILGSHPAPTWGSGGVSFTQGDSSTVKSGLTSDISITDTDNYSFGCYVKSYTVPSHSFVSTIMGSPIAWGEKASIDVWYTGAGLSFEHFGSSRFQDSTILDIPDGTLVSARRRNGGNTDVSSSSGNMTDVSSIAVADSNTTAFEFGTNSLATSFNEGSSFTASVFYIGEGLAHNQILMESAIKELMSDLGY